MTNIDLNQRNADWIKTLFWEFPTDPDSFLLVIGGREKLAHFLTLPAAEAMPAELRTALTGKSRKYSEDQPRDERGRFGETGGSDTVTPENYQDHWKPSMTPEEGHAWAKAAGTKYPNTVVHITNWASSDAIKGTGFHSSLSSGIAHESGVYFATDPATAEFYTLNKGEAIVSAAVVVQNPLELDFTTLSADSELFNNGYFEKDPDGFREYALTVAGVKSDDVSRVSRDPDMTTIALKSLGYDSVVVHGIRDNEAVGPASSAVGGNQVIVFDKEQAVAIGVTDVYGDEVTSEHGIEAAFAKQKGSPDQARDEHGRWTSDGGGSGDNGDPNRVTSYTPDTKNSPEWKDITKEIRAQGKGNCYEASATLMLNAQQLGLHNPTVIQATVMGQGDLAGQRYGHSWLEADAEAIGDHPPFRNAYDWSSGNSVVMPDALYRMLGQAEDVHEYTQKEAFEKMIETKVYGPWE